MSTTTARHDVLVAAREHGWKDVEIAWLRSRFTRGAVVVRIDWSDAGGRIVSATREEDGQVTERTHRTDRNEQARVLAWLRGDGMGVDSDIIPVVR